MGLSKKLISGVKFAGVVVATLITLNFSVNYSLAKYFSNQAEQVRLLRDVSVNRVESIEKIQQGERLAIGYQTDETLAEYHSALDQMWNFHREYENEKSKANSFRTRATLGIL